LETLSVLKQNVRHVTNRKNLKVLLVKLRTGIFDEDISASNDDDTVESSCEIVSKTDLNLGKKQNIIGFCIVPGEDCSVAYVCKG
jgi:succinyl-CoA synthetase beta subunit